MSVRYSRFCFNNCFARSSTLLDVTQDEDTNMQWIILFPLLFILPKRRHLLNSFDFSFSFFNCTNSSAILSVFHSSPRDIQSIPHTAEEVVKSSPMAVIMCRINGSEDSPLYCVLEISTREVNTWHSWIWTRADCPSSPEDAGVYESSLPSLRGWIDFPLLPPPP